MTDQSKGQTTQLLHAAAEGDKEAVDKLWACVHEELRQLAASKLRKEKASVTLSPTMLVSECFLRLASKDGTFPDWENTPHFFGTVARSMSQFLIDRARKRNSLKRGGNRVCIPFELTVGELAATDSCDDDRLEQVGRLLSELQQAYPRQADVAYLRWVQGLTIAETAAVLELTSDRVSKDWTLAQAWLMRSFTQGEEND